MGEQHESADAGVAPPITFGGSAKRIWAMVDDAEQGWLKALLGIVAVVAIAVTWCVVAVVYVVWGIFVMPVQRLASRRRAVESIGAAHVKHSTIVNNNN